MVPRNSNGVIFSSTEYAWSGTEAKPKAGAATLILKFRDCANQAASVTAQVYSVCVVTMVGVSLSCLRSHRKSAPTMGADSSVKCADPSHRTPLAVSKA